ncbi:MAG: Ger(x)C family spore germination C-terminal domain-containing protein [Clostridia bacterium]|nr:Ger(x)C family spore germination C-terminal domain-containing protein [Clostridia bacterium]
MKKPKFINKKWLVILVISLVLVTFSFLDEQKSIAARTIVLALSLDKVDDEYEVGIQVLKTDKSEKQEFLTYFSKGDNISDIIEHLSYDTGSTVALCHATVLIIGQDVLNTDDNKAMNFFFEGEVLCNNTMVVTSEQSPREVLSPTLSNGVGSGYFLGQVLHNMVGDFGIIPITIKDFFQNKYRIGSCVYLPCVSLEKEGDTTFLDITKSYVSDGKKGVMLSEKATKGLSLVLNKISNGTLPYQYESSVGELNFVKSAGDIKIEKDSDKAKLQIKATLKDNTYVPDKINEELCKEYVSKEIISYIEECYNNCKDEGLDVFYLGQRCYAYENELYKDPSYLEKLQLEIDVKINMK